MSFLGARGVAALMVTAAVGSCFYSWDDSQQPAVAETGGAGGNGGSGGAAGEMASAGGGSGGDAGGNPTAGGGGECTECVDLSTCTDGPCEPGDWCEGAQIAWNALVDCVCDQTTCNDGCPCEGGAGPFTEGCHTCAEENCGDQLSACEEP